MTDNYCGRSIQYVIDGRAYDSLEKLAEKLREALDACRCFSKLVSVVEESTYGVPGGLHSKIRSVLQSIYDAAPLAYTGRCCLSELLAHLAKQRGSIDDTIRELLDIMRRAGLTILVVNQACVGRRPGDRIGDYICLYTDKRLITTSVEPLSQAVSSIEDAAKMLLSRGIVDATKIGECASLKLLSASGSRNARELYVMLCETSTDMGLGPLGLSELVERGEVSPEHITRWSEARRAYTKPPKQYLRLLVEHLEDGCSPPNIAALALMLPLLTLHPNLEALTGRDLEASCRHISSLLYTRLEEAPYRVAGLAAHIVKDVCAHTQD